MLCSTVAASSLEKRAPKKTAAFDATVKLLVKEQAHVVVKAFADVCTDADINKAISTNVRVQITDKLGLVDIDFGVGAKVNTAIKTSIKTVIKAEVDAEIKAEFTKTLNANIAAIIIKRCPNLDAASIRLQAKHIVSEAAKLTIKASIKISAKVQAKIQAKVKAAVELQVKKLSVDFILLKIKVSGDAAVSASLGLKFKAAVDLCIKACASIQAKQVSKIRAICAAK
ncbi:hypothetical protein BGX27_011607 [Mortierella sp. AM989]|nr:hypothetical protein BGX27_011607 [Mortierella sp. AM989]